MDKSAFITCFCTKPWNCVWNKDGYCEMHECPCRDVCIALKEEKDE